MAASLATLRELERRDAVGHFQRIGTFFKEQIDAGRAVAVGLDAGCEGVAAHPHIRLGAEDAATAAKVNTAVHPGKRPSRRDFGDWVHVQLRPRRGRGRADRGRGAGEFLPLLPRAWSAGPWTNCSQYRRKRSFSGG